MTDSTVPEDLRQSPLLRFGEDGSVRIRWGWALLMQLVAPVLVFAVLFYRSSWKDVWFGLSLAVFGFTTFIAWKVIHLRRHLRMAREPSQHFRLPVSEPTVPDNLRQSPLLRFGEDGEVRLRFGWVFWMQWALSVVAVAALLYLSRVNDAWFVPPLIVGGFTAFFIWKAIQVRRHLRIARSPQDFFRTPLIDIFLLTAAVAVFFAGWTINDRQRSAELTRRSEIKRAAAEILGPNGNLERDRRARVWLTIGDPTFDDARFLQLLELLEYDQQRYGITRLGFVAGPWISRTSSLQPWSGFTKTLQPWPRFTEASVEPIAQLTTLHGLWLNGTAIRAAEATSLLALPNLKTLSMSDAFTDEVADRALQANPELQLTDGRGWPRQLITAPVTPMVTTPPPRPAAGSRPPANPGSPPGLPGWGAAPLSLSSPNR